MLQNKIHAWLTFYFPDNIHNSVARDLLGVDELGITTPVYLILYPSRKPLLMVSQMEREKFDRFARKCRIITYYSRKTIPSLLTKLAHKTIAAEYNPDSPSSPFPASLKDFLTSKRARIVSSSPLVNLTLVPVNKKQFASHIRASKKLSSFANSAFSLISHSLRKAKPITEKQVQNHLVSLFAKRGLVSDRPPIVAFGKDAANIHHEAGSTRIKRGELVLIDLWARETASDSIYADMTLMAFAGKKSEIPAKFSRAFASLVCSRNRCLENMQTQFEKKGKIVSHLADSAVRKALRAYPDYPHGTGHNILHDVHGPGPGILKKYKRAYELAPGGLYSLEPGIYVKNSFGMRSEIDFYFDAKNGIRPTTDCQKELVILL